MFKLITNSRFTKLGGLWLMANCNVAANHNQWHKTLITFDWMEPQAACFVKPAVKLVQTGVPLDSIGACVWFLNGCWHPFAACIPSKNKKLRPNARQSERSFKYKKCMRLLRSNLIQTHLCWQQFMVNLASCCQAVSRCCTEVNSGKMCSIHLCEK